MRELYQDNGNGGAQTTWRGAALAREGLPPRYSCCRVCRRKRDAAGGSRELPIVLQLYRLNQNHWKRKARIDHRGSFPGAACCLTLRTYPVLE
ncbi:MAG: hypothetical protein JO025_28790 [Verrucomicrobia bacterium]|nr:hypothetical protein [Verrucomicrobiota bacterium]